MSLEPPSRIADLSTIAPNRPVLASSKSVPPFLGASLGNPGRVRTLAGRGRASQLRLKPQHISQLERLSEMSYPFEACGLLTGRYREPGVAEAEGLIQALNASPSDARHRYVVDPEDFLAVDLEARSAGREIIGVWHTHPDSQPVPSAVDLEAAWESYSYLIVSVDPMGKSELRSWRLVDESFVEESVSVR